MDRERLAELLQHPARTAESDLAGLRAMAGRFPWFSGARLLMAVGAHGTGNVLDAEGQETSAAHLPSRAVLYDLLHPEETVPATVAMQVVREEVAVPPLPTPAAPIGTAPATGPDPDQVAQDAMEQRPEPEVRNEEEGGQAPDATGPATPLAGGKTAALPGEAPGTPDFLARLYAEAVQSTHFNIEQWATPAPPPQPAGPEQHAEPGESRPVPPEPSGGAIDSDAAPPTASDRMRLTDWLAQASTPSPGATAPTPAPPAAHEAGMGVKAAAGPDPGVPDQSAILDRFIQHAIPPPKAEKAAFFTPQKAAKRSLQDEGVVSETLARIHEKQGNFAKAKEVYDRLAVLHPGKSIYFAALSKALEGRTNK